VLADFRLRVRSLFRRGAVDRELDDELAFHLEHEIDKRVAAGVPRDEAERQARLAFGGITQIKEAHRDARGINFLDTVIQDIRYGLRAMRRSPVFAATAVATIALSTAALACAFTLAYTLLYRRLPVSRPDELVEVSGVRLRSGGPSPLSQAEAARLQILGPVSHPDYLSFRRGTRTLSALAAHYPTAPLFVTINGAGREVNGAVVSANFFQVMGLRPALGRFFHEDEDRVPDRDRVAVVSPNFWRNWLAAAPSPIGAHLTINGADFTIVGVAPPDFAGTTPLPIEIYIPTAMLRVGYRWCDDALAADCPVVQMIGRLAPGRSLADAAAEFPTLMPAAWARAPRGENSGIAVTQRRGMSEDDAEPRLVRMLAVAAGVLLLVCCANLSGLVSAQSSARAHEFGIRLSLGAAPRRVVRQLTTEAAMLAAGGGILGVGLSRIFVAALSAMFFAVDDEGHPLYYDFSQTTAIVTATLVVALMAGLLFSIVPAVQIARHTTLARTTAREATPRWSAGAWLLAAQAAIAVAMVAIAALLTSSADAIVAGRNFDASHIALVRVRPRLVKYTPERAQRFQREVVRRVSSMPAVEAVSMVGIGAVLSGGSVDVALPEWTGQQRVRAGYNEVGPRYFSTLGVPLRTGREFDDHDTAASPRVAIVSEALAATLWPGRPALGATVLVRGVAHEVIAVVADVSLRSRTEPVAPWIYVPFWQNPNQIDSRLAIRVAGDPAAMLPAIEREVNRADPDVPVSETLTLPGRLAALLRPVRIGAAFIGYTAVLAVLLTAVGLYAALAFAVTRRTREIGIRVALGAARSQIVGAIVRDGAIVTAVGTAVGLGLAVAGTRLVTSLLYAPASADWIAYAVGAALVLAVGLLASFAPARRAASVEPLVALREN
jgi:predicted permease